jgi:hypothetical protein
VSPYNFFFEVSRVKKDLRIPAQAPGCLHEPRAVIGIEEWGPAVTVAIHNPSDIDDHNRLVCFLFHEKPGGHYHKSNLIV